MKKILTVLTISFSALIASNLTMAAPHFKDDQGNDDRPRNMHSKKDYDMRNGDNNERRMREERGVKRLQQHRWQTGYVMPQHYRGDGYKVDYKDNNLPKPTRNQQWYKINNDYILVDSDNNNILKVFGL